MIRHLLSKYGEEVGDQPWNTYPRPQMVRDEWLNLNGTWHFGTDREMNEEILVPFCPESLLSGIRHDFKEESSFYYGKTFDFPAVPDGCRVLLHFGAADQIAEVSLNDVFLGRHEGGYLPFTFDVTDTLRTGGNRLFLRVTDALDRRLPWGKQKKERGGMWYTPFSGIWQTVWMERVPENYIHDLKIRTDHDRVCISIEGLEEGSVTLEESGECFLISGGRAEFTVRDPRYWSPESPHLYYFTVRAGKDCVRSYFALRDLSVRMIGGRQRLCLNGEPYFFHGLLDQGYYSDGICTPASPTCFEEDIGAVKSLGFNTLRKHIKIEPEQFYYDCDRLGIAVFQDMVNCGEYRFLRDTVLPTAGFTALKDRHMNPDSAARENFLRAMEETVRHLQNHPCICCWTIFNEGWGQFEADKAYDLLKKLDEQRFADSTSGWFRQRKSDVESLHIYFRKLRLGKSTRPQVLSEFGGYVWKDPEHCAVPDKTYGYKVFRNREKLTESVRKLYLEEVLPLAEKGLCASIYTQVSDVEEETNGLLSYDRKVLKIRPEELADIAGLLQEAVKKQGR